MQRVRFTVFLLSLLVLIPAALSGQNRVEADGSVLLPAQVNTEMSFDRSKQFQMTRSFQWQEFQRKHGNWSVQWNEATGTPHRAFGKGIPVEGFGVLTKDNIEAASRKFLQENSQALRVETTQLAMMRAQKVRNKWYVTFKQMKGDVPVLFSEIELRFFENGNLMAFGADFYPEIELDMNPLISYQDAQFMALEGLEFNSATDNVAGEGTLYVLPVRTGQNLTYHLVYEVNVQTKSTPGNYDVFVDAHTGEIIWRHNRVRYESTGVQVNGMVQLEIPTGPFVEEGMTDLRVSVDGAQLVTDSAGYAETDITATSNVTARLSSPWLDVRNANGPNADYSGTVDPGDTLDILWDDNNSLASERDSYFHGTFVYNFLKTLDPNMTAMDYSMPCSVNIGPENPIWPCNAFWDGVGINFFNAGGGCPDIGQMPSVVYHEYGHGVNDRLFQQAGAQFGMINGATHEGIADVLSAMVEDVPNIGRGFFGPGTTLRFISNTRRYPDNVTGSSHSDGLIIGGAFWDLRQLTSREVARDLFHFARWGTPDDADLGTAFSEWFIEVLIADDDDGDLDNGTPHMDQIVEAFNNHGIGSSLFILASFNHTPVANTPDTTSAYPVTFEVTGFGPGVDSLAVVYSIDGFQTEMRVDAQEINANEYQADIPAQARGAKVDYYIHMRDVAANQDVRFPRNGSYTFLVGYDQILFDPLEAESGWTIGASDDNATTGIWNRMDPQATSGGSQPENDNTPNGTDCFVTDGRNSGGAGTYDVDGGKTTLFSPIINVDGMQNPVLSYYKWYSNDLGNNPGQDFWVVDISNDGGETWVNLENTNASTDGWESIQFNLEDYLPATDSMQIRFVASDFGGGSLVEACIDDVEILALGSVTGINDLENSLPDAFELSQNFPNPFNPSTTIRYAVSTNAQVVIKIYNLLGQEVRTLVSGNKAAGRYAVEWNGTSNTGAQVASGIYLYRMEAVSGNDRFVQTNKLMLLK